MVGDLIVISGPSGVGKSTLLKKLFSEYPDMFTFSVSTTSRLPREGEKEGREYFFVAPSDFKKQIEQGEFLEWAEVHGNYYGTSYKIVDDLRKGGKHCILDIDVQGGAQLKEQKIDAKFIFIAPESIDVLKERLLTRGADSNDDIAVRLKNAEKELTYKEKYDYIVINKDLDEAYDDLKDIMLRSNE